MYFCGEIKREGQKLNKITKEREREKNDKKKQIKTITKT